MTTSKEPVTRPLLSGTLGFVALNAFAGGVYGFRGADGIPTEWLRGTPFDDYLVPSMILFVVVGGSSLLAAAAVIRRSRAGRAWALAAGFTLMTWLGVQVAMIGYVSWMQPVFAAISLLELALGWNLPARGSRSRR